MVRVARKAVDAFSIDGGDISGEVRIVFARARIVEWHWHRQW